MDEIYGPPSTFSATALLLSRELFGNKNRMYYLSTKQRTVNTQLRGLHMNANRNEGNEFLEKSKELHKEYSREYWAGAFDPEHPDTKRHYSLLSSGDGLLSNLSLDSILSVGDNFGRDVGYFKRYFPDAKCTASDLYAAGISKAVTEGHIDSVISADVEALPFGDCEIDCVIAKEAFHHWPRPMLGLYEMLRVAKKAVMLIEPSDVINGIPTPNLNEKIYTDEYEEVGNYKYQVSLREILKSAWSLYYPAVAAVGFNDPYHPERNYEDWVVEKNKLDFLGDLGERQFNLLCIVIYKPNYAPLQESLPTRARLYRRPPNPFTE